jgi:hypothetical protein
LKTDYCFIFFFSFEYFSGNLRRDSLEFENWNLNSERLKPYIPTMVGLREIKEKEEEWDIEK